MANNTFDRDKFWYKRRFIDFSIHRRKYVPRTNSVERKVFGYFNDFCLSYIAYIEMALTFQPTGNSQNRYRDRELAADVMFNYMANKINVRELLVELQPYAEECRNHIRSISARINFTGDDLELLRNWDISNPETLHSFLQYLYKMRCTFFHGDKFDFNIMIDILRPTCLCLRKINFVLFKAMNEDIGR